ncbi:protein kinase [Streptomyces sp. NPDC056061]|uniref:protein kinase n=1 Tax=Streptomyces sp. NPDC056061 TaxID=3345700 RepID=UPI0035DDBF81
MDDYAGRVLADRYRLPLPPSDAYELVESRAFDTYSGQEVLVRQVPLPEVVDAEVLDADGPVPSVRQVTGRAVRRPADPAVRRAVEAAQAAAQVPDHPRLDQVFDVFAEAGSLWIVSEFIAARPLADLLAEGPLNPFRAAEIGSDVLAALRVLHAHGWTHRNITARTVLVCDDGRVVLTGLAAGAAEEALCGYVPTPRPDDEDELGYGGPPGSGEAEGEYEYGAVGPTGGPDVMGPYAPPPPLLPPEVPAVRGPAADGKVAIEKAAVEKAAVDKGATRGEAHDVSADGRYDGDAHDGTGAYDADVLDDGYDDADVYDGTGAYGTGVHDGGYDDADLYDDGYGAHEDGAQENGTREEGIREEAAHGGARTGAASELEAVPSPMSHVRPAPGPGADDTAPLPVQRSAGPENGGPLALGGVRPQSADPWDGDDEDVSDEDLYTGGPSAAAPYPRAASAAVPHDDADNRADERDDRAHDDAHERDGDGDGRTPPGPSTPGRRVYLTGTWDDGPETGRPVPAGGSDGFGGDTPFHDALPALGAHRPERGGGAGGWGELVASGLPDAPYRGPATPLAAERARQARIALVGAVTERWAPEQGGPVHENWRLAPPIGPATDLWALGALLYRAVQGHAPYPEENAAELVQMVCGEPPAFAEECGPLRPVVESLLRQDPTDRPDVEELSGWLRSLVRSAPEPEAGLDVVPLPADDAARLPIVRRRGELVRRRRGLFGRGAVHGRHRSTGEQPDRRDRPVQERAPRPEKAPRPPKPSRAPREPKVPKALRTPPPGSPQHEGRSPGRLGRLLLVLILLALAAAIGYAVLFMPREGGDPDTSGRGAPASGEPRSGTGDTSGEQPSVPPSGAQQPQTTRSAVAVAAGYTLRKDPEGFEVAVLKDWQRTPANADRQIRYGADGFSLLIVPGRDTVKTAGADPLAYQADKERELQQFRDSSWSGSSGLRRIDVGRQAMAEGQFTWQDDAGREVYARNLALIIDGRYHVIQVIGPESRRDEVSDIYQQAVASYRMTR